MLQLKIVAKRPNELASVVEEIPPQRVRPVLILQTIHAVTQSHADDDHTDVVWVFGHGHLDDTGGDRIDGGIPAQLCHLR